MPHLYKTNHLHRSAVHLSATTSMLTAAVHLRAFLSLSFLSLFYSAHQPFHKNVQRYGWRRHNPQHQGGDLSGILLIRP